MKNLYPRLTKAPADAPVTYSNGISQNCSVCADTPTGYTVSKNQHSKKPSLLQKVATVVVLLLFVFIAGITKVNAQSTISPANGSWWKLKEGEPTGPGTAGITAGKIVFDATGNAYVINRIGSTFYLTRRQTSGIIDTTWLNLGSTGTGYTFTINEVDIPLFYNCMVLKPSDNNLYILWTRVSTPMGQTTDFLKDSVFVGQVSNLNGTPIFTKRWKAIANDNYTSWSSGIPSQTVKQLHLDNTGNMYVILEKTIVKIADNGTVTAPFCTPFVSNLLATTEMVSDNNGNLYVARSRKVGISTTTTDQYITKINTAGVADTTWFKVTNDTMYNNRPIKIAYSNGFIYAAHLGQKPGYDSVRISKIDVASGTGAVFKSLRYPYLYIFRQLSDIVSDNTNNIYITEEGAGTVHRIYNGVELDSAWLNFSNPTNTGTGYMSVSPSNQVYMGPRVQLPPGMPMPGFPVNRTTYYSKLVGAFSVSISSQNATCAGINDGTAKAVANGCTAGSYTYLWTPGNFTTDSIGGLAPGTYNVRVICSGDTVNKSVVIAAGSGPAAPSASNQSLCNGATVADLVATPSSGNTIVWYATATGGTALANNTALVNATKYYAAQVTPANCESSVRAVDSVTIQATVAARNDSSYCNGSSIAVNFVGASGNTYNWTATQNGTGIAASGTGNTSFTGVNNTNAVVTDTVIVSSSFNICTPQKDTFAISVLPTPKVDSIADMWVCPSTVVPAINFTTPITGGTVGYKWTNNNTAIGLAASGFGNIPSFTSPATTQNTFRSTINVRPYILKSATDTCFGALRTFTITSGLPPGVLLGGRTQTRVIYTGSKTINQLDISPGAGFTLNYYYQPTGGTALPGTTPVVDDTTYYVTRALAGCESNPRKIVPVNRIANDTIVFCKPDSVANLTATTAANITASWYDVPSFGPNLASSTPITAVLDTLYVDEYGMYQPGRFAVISNRVPVIVMVNPTPANVVATTDKAVCNNSTVAAVNFSTTNTVGATTYAWTNNKTSIGLAASGTGNIASFTAVNNGTVPDTATIIVAPTITNLGLSCEGIKDTFLIIVNPTAAVNTVSNQVVCNGSAVTSINFGTTNTGGTVTYAWTNNTTSIGLAASGNENIATFNGVNNGTSPVTATITVTPTFTNGGVSCAGSSQTFTITVNPTANVNALNDHVLCNGANFAEVAPTTTATGGTVTYAWTNNTTSIGLAASGTGNVPAFTAVNNGTAPVTATVIVTPTFANGGVNCTGTADTFYIAVNPTAKIDTITNKVACNGATVAAVTPTSTATGGTVTYAWTIDNAAIGLAASGTGTIPAFTAINTGTAPVTATITVTPTFTNNGLSCEGTVRTYTVTVNPTATVNTVSNQVVCNGSAVAAVNFSTTATGGTVTYAWTNSNITIGLSASGSGNIASFTATNSGTAPVTATITVTPTFTNDGVSCQGTAQTFTITVNPTATVNAISNQTVCNGAAVSAVNFATAATGGTVTYAWTNNNSSIGLAASGTGNIASFNAINSSNAPVTATITVTPTFTNGGVSCTGTAQSFTVTVNPTAVVNAVNSQIVCAGSSNSAVTFSSPVAGTTYSWTNSNPSIGLAASGTGNVPSFVAVNPSPNAINATITVTPNTPEGCVGAAITYTITVNGWSVAPSSINNPTPIVCANNAFTTLSVNGGALGSGAVWKWYADSLNTVSIGTGATLSNIPVAKTTTYFVRAEGTCNNTAAASVVVQRANLVSHVRQHWSDVLLFDNSSKNFVAWQWYKNGVAVSGSTLQQYSESSALVGTYYVVATDKNGEKTITCPLTITAGSFTGLKISLFPNPADKGANVTIATSFTASELQGATITISDIYGRVIRQITNVSPNTTIQAPAATGMYVVTLTLQNGVKYSSNLLTN